MGQWRIIQVHAHAHGHAMIPTEAKLESVEVVQGEDQMPLLLKVEVAVHYPMFPRGMPESYCACPSEYAWFIFLI